MNTQRDKYYMAGTEGTGEYVVTVANGFARVGFRQIPFGQVRVRVEPQGQRARRLLATCLTRGDGWKQPGDSRQDRFSIVLGDNAEANKVIRSLTVTARFYGIPLACANAVNNVRARLSRRA